MKPCAAALLLVCVSACHDETRPVGNLQIVTVTSGHCCATREHSSLRTRWGTTLIESIHGHVESPDGRWLLGETKKPELVVVDLREERVHSTLELPSEPWIRPDPPWSPDGKRLLFTCTTGREEQVFIAECGTDGVQLVKVHSEPGGVFLPTNCWSPDGASFAVRRSRGSGSETLEEPVHVELGSGRVQTVASQPVDSGIYWISSVVWNGDPPKPSVAK